MPHDKTWLQQQNDKRSQARAAARAAAGKPAWGAKYGRKRILETAPAVSVAAVPAGVEAAPAVSVAAAPAGVETAPAVGVAAAPAEVLPIAPAVGAAAAADSVKHRLRGKQSLPVRNAKPRISDNADDPVLWAFIDEDRRQEVFREKARLEQALARVQEDVHEREQELDDREVLLALREERLQDLEKEAVDKIARRKFVSRGWAR